MHCIKSNFDKILHVLTKSMGNNIPMDGNILRPGPKPKFTDIEIMALALTAEIAGISSENHLFHILNTNYKSDFPNLLSRRQYNDRLKSMFPVIKRFREIIVAEMNELTEVFAIDSMPIELCKLSRFHRCTMAKDHQYAAPAKGFCASQNKYFYGYKLHAVCSPSGVIQEFDLTNAKTHDVQYLKDVALKFRNCIITGDKGYLNEEMKNYLFKYHKILLEVPSRSNQLVKTKLIKPLRIIRKRIETVFSQLTLHFNIQTNFAKQFYGYRVRVLAKISSFTLLQYFNYLSGRPIGKIKNIII